MPRRLSAWMAAAGGVAIAAWLLCSRNIAGQAEAVPDLPMPQRDLLWQGSTSCAASACHNATGPKGTKASEYTTWASCDPHARAGAVLFNERSKLIEKNYRGLRTQQEAHAETDVQCLRCHAPGAVANRAPCFRQCEAVADGVGCESCHGPAEKWRSEHFRARWRLLSSKEKLDEFGFNPTKELLFRAKSCAGCHVGGPGAEVNHELIAAGHPRLNFDFGAFLAILPKHWPEAEDKASYPDLEARAWMLGQVVSARTALELLAYRAESGLDAAAKPWPEFAEYDCFACHHNLQGISWRQKRDLNHLSEKARLGELSWGTWYYPMLPRVLEAQAGQERPEDLIAQLAQLRQEMGERLPNRTEAARRARETANQLQPWALKLAAARCADCAPLDRLFKTVAEDKGNVPALAGTGRRRSISAWRRCTTPRAISVRNSATRPSEARLAVSPTRLRFRCRKTYNSTARKKGSVLLGRGNSSRPLKRFRIFSSDRAAAWQERLY